MQKLKVILCGVGMWLWWLMTYLWIPTEAIIIYAILLVFDFFFGVIEVYLHDKTKLKSQTAKKWFFRKMVSFCLPFFIALIVKWAAIAMNAENIADVVGKYVISWGLGILILIEWYSILWHFYNIKTGQCLPEIHGFEYFTKKVASLFFGKIKWE